MFNFQPFCEKDYLNTLEKCCKCQEPILDRILRATGKPYHPQVKQFFVYIVKQASLLHIQWDLNNGLFWYSNGPKWSDHGMVCYSNGDLNKGHYRASEQRKISSINQMQFEQQTKFRYSDVSGIQIPGIQIPLLQTRRGRNSKSP